MASKGQKFKVYSSELKQEILDKCLSGKGTSRFLAQEYNISFKTIENWIFKTKKGKNFVSIIDFKRTYGYRRVCEGLLVKYGVTLKIVSIYNLRFV